MTCEEVSNKNSVALQAFSDYQNITSPTENDFGHLTTTYSGIRDFAIKAASTETNYDIQLLLQVTALQNTVQYLGYTIYLGKYDLAWKEMKYCYDNIYNVINYQKLNRQDNFIMCSLPNNRRLKIKETDYDDICTQFICYCCNIIYHYKNHLSAQIIFAKAGFKGLLSQGSLLHRTAANILIERLDNGQLDDTSYLAAYKFLITNNEPHTLEGITGDFVNNTNSKALDVLVNTALVARSSVSPLKDIDEFKKNATRYDHLYAILQKDSGFTFHQKFELLRIALSDYLNEMQTIKITNHSFWQLPELHRLLDETFEADSIKKELQEILKSGNSELINLLAQVYELYGQNCYNYYPLGFQAHYYFNAYLCYRAIGDNKKANKAFNDIPKSYRYKNAPGFYRKLD